MIFRFFYINTILAVCCLPLAGCGYKLGSLASREMQTVKTIHVPVAVNETFEPGLGPLVTEAVIQRLMRDGTFRITRRTTADSELLIRLHEISRRPLRATLVDERRTAEYELRIRAEVLCRRLSDGVTLLHNKNIVGKTEYFVGQDLQEGERQALGLIAGNIAEQIVIQLVEGW